MNTATYLIQHKRQVKNPQEKHSYRVIGFHIPGQTYTIYKIEDDIVYFKGYNIGRHISKLKFFEVN